MVSSNASGYTTPQYQYAQTNDRVNANSTTMNYESTHFANNSGFNNVQQVAGYYPENAAALPQYHTSPQQQPKTSQAGLPSPAAGTTAPTSSGFGHQHLGSARHCNCNNQHCNSHYYTDGDRLRATRDPSVCKVDNTWQCNTARNQMARCNPPSQMINCNMSYNVGGFTSTDQFNNMPQDGGGMNPGNEYMNAYENMQNNLSFNMNPANVSVHTSNANYNCNHMRSPIKFTQQSHFQQQIPVASQQHYQNTLNQQHQFFQSQSEQRINQTHSQQQQQFKTQPQYHEYHQQMQQQPQNFQNRRTSSGSVRGTDRELQSNVISRSSLNNMRPTTYERTLQYVEQCQMFSVSGTTNQNDASNMVINDMTSSLNSLLEENKYLQMIQQ